MKFPCASGRPPPPAPSCVRPGAQDTCAQPLDVDLRTGLVHAIPPARWSVAGGTVSFKRVAVYDPPILIADRVTLPLDPSP